MPAGVIPWAGGASFAAAAPAAFAAFESSSIFFRVGRSPLLRAIVCARRHFAKRMSRGVGVVGVGEAIAGVGLGLGFSVAFPADRFPPRFSACMLFFRFINKLLCVSIPWTFFLHRILLKNPVLR
jgi:hypothetical protein